MALRGGQAERERMVLLQLPRPQVRDRVAHESGNEDRILEGYWERSHDILPEKPYNCWDEEDACVL